MYLACSSTSLGWRACIWRLALNCLAVRGKSTALMVTVRRMIAIPYECVNA
ncbi:hypothetical protein D3C87_1734220 [compost metagenome]